MILFNEAVLESIGSERRKHRDSALIYNNEHEIGIRRTMMLCKEDAGPKLIVREIQSVVQMEILATRTQCHTYLTQEMNACFPKKCSES
jgi:hypothetical protein